MELKKQNDNPEEKAEQNIEKFIGPQSHSSLLKSIEKPVDDSDSDREVYFDRPATQQKPNKSISDKTTLTKEKKPSKVTGQSLYDSRFSDFRKSIMSSISQKEFKNVVNIQSQIEKHTID